MTNRIDAVKLTDSAGSRDLNLIVRGILRSLPDEQLARVNAAIATELETTRMQMADNTPLILFALAIVAIAGGAFILDVYSSNKRPQTLNDWALGASFIGVTVAFAYVAIAAGFQF